MKKLVIAFAIVIGLAVAQQASATGCKCVDDTPNVAGGHVYCCEAAGAPDPANPPENLCGQVDIGGQGTLAGCVSEDTGVKGCLEGSPGSLCADIPNGAPITPSGSQSNTDFDACNECGCLGPQGPAC